MASQIHTKEDAIRVLKERINKFGDDLAEVTSGLGADTQDLLKSMKEANFDPQKRDKLLNQLKGLLENTWWDRLWTYGTFTGCLIVILVIFVFLGYYKLYRPLAEKERKQIQKKAKKHSAKHTTPQHVKKTN